MHARVAGVQVVQDVGDAATLAGTAPTLEQHNDADAVMRGLFLQHDQTGDEPVALFLVLGLAELFLLEINFVEHRIPFSQLRKTLPHSGRDGRTGIACRVRRFCAPQAK